MQIKSLENISVLLITREVKMERKVAIITGGNGGIGLTLAERLLIGDPTLRICLACRNLYKANIAKKTLELSHPNSEITVVTLDVSNISSVIKAVQEIKEKYVHVDYLFLNAGILPVTKINWDNLIKGIFSKNVFHMFLTGENLLHQIDEKTDDGINNIFATNVFGHFVLIRKLEDILGQSQPSQLIWTSSSNAKKEYFDINDIEHNKGVEPYSSSKYATDVLSVALNHKLNNQGIYSHTTCPGLVMTNLTNGILPPWFWILLKPIFLLLRLFVNSFTLSPYNGVECMHFLSKQKPETIDPFVKFHSCCTFWGETYIKEKKINVDIDFAEQLYHKLEELHIKVCQKMKE